MNEQELKLINKHIKCHILKLENDIKLFWIKYVLKKHYELKNTPQGNGSVSRRTSHNLCTYHQSELIGTGLNRSGTYRTVFIIIHMRVPNNFWFGWKTDITIPARTEPFSFSFACTYQTIFDSNENQSSIKLPKKFRFEWKSELNQTGSKRCIVW